MSGLNIWQRVPRTWHSPWLTHVSLAALLALEFSIILSSPLWISVPLCVAVHHRIGIMLHEYMHGIPLRRYSQNLAVFSAVNGLLATFGVMEVFRGNHLAHHRWLNTEQDPGYWRPEAIQARQTLIGHGPLMYTRLLWGALRERHSYIRPRRVVWEAVLSAAVASAWLTAGYPQVPAALLLLHVFVVPLGMCRGAMEHTAHPGDPGFANEYRVWLPLFNMNRHIHHHLDPTLPWYMLRFHTQTPRPPIEYWTHWYRTFIRKELVFMQPMPVAERYACRKK